MACQRRSSGFHSRSGKSTTQRMAKLFFGMSLWRSASSMRKRPRIVAAVARSSPTSSRRSPAVARSFPTSADHLGEGLELAAAEQIADVLELEAEAEIGFVGAEAVHGFGVGEPGERRR